MGSSQRFCIWCGQELRQGGRFCTACGRTTTDASQATPLISEEQLPAASPEDTATRQMAAEPRPTAVTSPAPVRDRTSEGSSDGSGSMVHPGWSDSPPPYGGASPRPVRRRRSRWPVVLGLIALLCAGGAASALLILHPFRNSRAPSVASPARSPIASPASTASTGASQQVSPVASATAPATVGVVSIGSAVADDPRAQTVAGIFNTYFSSINQRDYTQALSVFDPGSPLHPQSPSTVRSLTDADATTTDSNVVLTSLRPPGNGPATEAAVTFRSRQAAGYGPAGSPDQTCTVWQLRYTLTQSSGSYLIYKVKGAHAGC